MVINYKNSSYFIQKKERNHEKKRIDWLELDHFAFVRSIFNNVGTENGNEMS